MKNFDEVVLATGIDPRRPQIAGIDHPMVAGYVDVLAGHVQPGPNVVIIGAGGIGFDVALYLLERKGRSTLDSEAFNRHWGISEDASLAGGLKTGKAKPENPEFRITMLKRSTTPFGSSLGRTTGWVHRAELARNGVQMIGGVEYRRIDDAGIHVAVEGREKVIPADTIVVCAGQTPLVPFTVAGRKPHLIGGAREAGELDAKRAMLEGAKLAAAL